MNQFLLGFQGGQSIRMSTHQTVDEFIGEIAESLKSTPSNTVKWHQGNGFLINLSQLSFVAPSNGSSLEADPYRP